ncbi:hypothetical protein TrLO_g13721 [Triparma laevis f. longispina]|uniref:XK-related protein n=1 Tax=Triparma laevis f. longispina TaxID=1714387 RepID=A0A9W7ADV9_9STRA|nr:hypothetical protein TrLO_g13721 [Triparma laevis f. longispina]
MSLSVQFARENRIVSRVQLYGTALLCMFDMVTDILMVVKYIESKQYGFAKATLICISLNLFLQLLTNYFLNARKPIKTQIVEQLIVLSLVKQGVVAFRADTSTKQINIEEEILDAESELTITRIVEMVTEAVLGTVIQVAAIMTLKYDSTLVISLVSSIMCAAFLSAVISYEYDTSKENRRDKANFYGYVPDGLIKKLTVFTSLFSLSMFNLAVRSLTFVLVSAKGMSVVIGILVVEFILYFAVKIATRDFWYWVPADGVVGYLCATIVPTLIKLVSDWTAVVHFRCPTEVGGTYFLFNLFLTIAFGIISVVTYEAVETNETDETNEINGTIPSRDSIVIIMLVNCLGLVIKGFRFGWRK